MKFFSAYLNSIDSLDRLESRKNYIFKPYYDFIDPYKTVPRTPEYEIEANDSYSKSFNKAHPVNSQQFNDLVNIDTFRFSMDNILKSKEYNDYVIVDLTFVGAKIVTFPTLETVKLSDALINSELDIDILHYNSTPTPYDNTLRESFRKSPSFQKVKIPYEKISNEASKYIVIDDNYYAPRVDNVLIHDLKSLGLTLVSGTTTDILDKHTPSVIGYNIPRKEVKLVSYNTYVYVDDKLVPFKVNNGQGNITIDTMFLEENIIDFIVRETPLKDIADSYKFTTYSFNDNFKLNLMPRYNNKHTERKNFVVKLSNGVKLITNLADDTIELSGDLSTIGIYETLQLPNQLVSIDREYPTILTGGIDYNHKVQTTGLVVVKNDGTYVISDALKEYNLDFSLHTSFSSFNTTSESKRWNILDTRSTTETLYGKVEVEKTQHTHTFITTVDDSIYNTKLYTDIEHLIYTYREFNGRTTKFYTRPDIFEDIQFYTRDIRYYNVVADKLYKNRYGFKEVDKGFIDISNHPSSSLSYINKPFNKINSLYGYEKYAKRIAGEHDDYTVSSNVYIPYYDGRKIDIILSNNINDGVIELGSRNVNRLYSNGYIPSTTSGVLYRLLDNLQNDYKLPSRVYISSDAFDTAEHHSSDLINHPIESKVYIPTDAFSEVVPADVYERNYFIKELKVYIPTDIFSEVIPADITERHYFTKESKVYIPTDVFSEVIPADVFMINPIRVDNLYDITPSYTYTTDNTNIEVIPTTPVFLPSSKLYVNAPKFGYSDIIDRLIYERNHSDIKNAFSRLYYVDMFNDVERGIYELRNNVLYSTSKSLFNNVKPSDITINYNKLYSRVFNTSTTNKTPIGVNLLGYTETGIIYSSSSSIPTLDTQLIKLRSANVKSLYSNGFGVNCKPINISVNYNGVALIYDSKPIDKIGSCINISSIREEHTPSSYLNDITVGTKATFTGTMGHRLFDNLNSDKIGIIFDNRNLIEDKIYDIPLNSEIIGSLLSGRDTNVSGHFYSKKILNDVSVPTITLGIQKPEYEKVSRLQGIATSKPSNYIERFRGKVYLDQYTARFKEITGFTDRSPDTQIFNYNRDYFVGLDSYKYDTAYTVANIYGKTLKIPYSGVSKEPSLYSQAIYKFIEPRYAKLERPQGVTAYTHPILGLVYDGYLGGVLHTEQTTDLKQPIFSNIYDSYLGKGSVSDRTLSLTTYSSGIIYPSSTKLSADHLVYRDTKDTTVYINSKPVEKAINYDAKLGKKLVTVPSYIGTKLDYDIVLGDLIDVVPTQYERNETIKWFDSTRTNVTFQGTKKPFSDVVYLRYNESDLSLPLRYENGLGKYARQFEGTRSSLIIPQNNYLVGEKVSSITLSSVLFRYDNYAGKLVSTKLDIIPTIELRYDNYSQLSTFDRHFEGTRASSIYKLDNYDLSQYSRGIELSSKVYRTDVLYKNIGTATSDLTGGSFRYDNYGRISNFVDIDYKSNVIFKYDNYDRISLFKDNTIFDLELDLRTINSNTRPSKFVTSTPDIKHIGSTRLYNNTYISNDSTFGYSYKHKETLVYDPRDEKSNFDYDYKYQIDGLEYLESYRDLDTYGSDILFRSILTSIYDKKSNDDIVPNIGRLTIPIEPLHNNYPSIPSIVTGIIGIESLRKESFLYTSGFKGTTFSYDGLNTNIDKLLYSNDYTQEFTASSSDFRLLIDKIYGVSSKLEDTRLVFDTKFRIEKIYNRDIYSDVIIDTVDYTYLVSSLYNNLYVANTVGLNHNFDTKVSVDSVYNNLYLANIVGLNHRHSYTDADSALVSKLKNYNRYNYNFDELTNLYSKPSLSLYQRPFLKYEPRYFNESVQSYNTFDAVVNLKTIPSYRNIIPIVDYSIELSNGIFKYDKPVGVLTADIQAQESLYNPLRYGNDLSKYYHNYPSVTIDTPILYSKNYLTYSSSGVDKYVDLSTFRYESKPVESLSFDISIINVKSSNYLPLAKVADNRKTQSYVELRYDNDLSQYSKRANDIVLNTEYQRNYLVRSVSFRNEPSIFGLRYENDLSGYTTSLDVQLTNKVAKNYLGSVVVPQDYSSTTELRYDNNVSKYAVSYDIILNTAKSSNYLHNAISDRLEVGIKGLRYNNNLEKYSKLSYNVELKGVRADNYLSNKVVDVSGINLSSFRYDNNLDNYKSSFNILSSEPVKVASQSYLRADKVSTVSLVEFKYNNDLSKYKWSINTKTTDVLVAKYLPNLTGVSKDNIEAHAVTLRYENSLEKYNNRTTDITLVNEVHALPYGQLSEIYTSYNRTDLSQFKYSEDLSKYASETPTQSFGKPSFRYDNDNISTFKRSVNYNDTGSSIERPMSYSRVTEHKSYDYKVANSPDLKISGAYNKIKGITHINYGMMPNKPDANNLYKKQEILQGITQFGYKYAVNVINGALYSKAESVKERKPVYNKMVQTLPDAKIYKPRVDKSELTPSYKGTLKYTDIETRFTLRGPVNYDMYGDDVKVVMMEQNKQGFAWEQQMDSVAYKSKNLLQQESANTYKRNPVVVTGSPVLTRENQIEYYFGGQGKLKMEKISGTYPNPDGEYPLAAPINCTVKGIMRPTTSVAIQHIIEYDYDKIDEIDVVPVFNETGDRVSLFSDRFFLQ